MKSLQESLLDDDDKLFKETGDIAEAEHFLKENYIIKGTHTITNNVVDVHGKIIVKNHNIELLTNGVFKFGEVTKDFDCSECNELTSLKGAPKEVGGEFSCSNCDKLTSLKGAPKKVEYFSCYSCKNLTTLEGAPKRIGHIFDCSSCNELTSLKGGPERTGGAYYCNYCEKLISLEGAPKKCYMFCCQKDDKTGFHFDKDEVAKHVKVEDNRWIYV